jgi:hypothetical protein
VRDSYKVPLVRADGIKVEGEIFEGISSRNLDDFETHWYALLVALRNEAVKRIAAGDECHDGADYHWPWRRYVERLGTDLSWKQFALEVGGETQGLMQLSLVQRSRIEVGQHLVYVDRLAIAPWNRKSNKEGRRYRPVGPLLMRHAIGTSLSEGFAGRVGLHSLPGAADFYRDRLRMKSFGPDPAHQSLEYFELSAAQGQNEIEQSQNN